MTDENMKAEDLAEKAAEAETTETEKKEPEEQTSGDAVQDTAKETAENTEAKQEEADSETCAEEEAAETAEEEEETSDGDDSADPKKDKKLRWKKKDKKDEKIEELTDRLQRTMAEFDNYRKRTEKEKASMYIIGAKEVVEKMLPIIDNFERGLASAAEEQKSDPFVEGFDKIYKQLCKTMEDMGVKTIDAVGKEFDPNFHNAVMHVEDENVGENIVVEEFQKGYLYKDFVVRHSMVKVAN